MSRTLEEAVVNVRYKLRDRNPQAQAFTEPEVVHAIQAAVRLLAGEVLLGESWVDPFITVAAGTDTYAVPTGTVVDAIRFLRSASFGLEVPILGLQAFEANRNGDSAHSRGTPQIAFITESATQAMSIILWPTPNAADTYAAYRSALPAAFFNAGTGTLAALPSATVIPFDDFAFEAACCRTARQLFSRMTAETRARNMLGDGAAAEWENDEQRLIRSHRNRRRLQQSSNVKRTGRRW